MYTRVRAVLALWALFALVVPLAIAQAGPVEDFWAVQRTAVPAAQCGAGSAPETGLQGDVSLADRQSGRSAQGYSCNLSLLGQYQGEGAGITSVSYQHCSYTGSTWPTDYLGPNPGVKVVDVSDPAHPVLSTTLTEPAMRGGTWESLKVNEQRGLLAATGVGFLQGSGTFSIYDISQDCAHPRLLNTGAGTDPNIPIAITTHEGGFSPDGNTYWASGIIAGTLTAIDVSDPTTPTVLWAGNLTGITGHGFGVSVDGNRLYATNLVGITILDVSGVQRRDPHPYVSPVSSLFWSDGQISQHVIPVDYGGHPYLYVPGEAGSGGVKLIDIADEQNPRVSQTIKLAINLPPNLGKALLSSQHNGVFGYEAHYCAVDRPHDPTMLACGWTQSGVRLFDVSNPAHIVESAYFNPPAQADKRAQLVNSMHAGVGSIIGFPALGAVAITRAINDGDIAAQDVANNPYQVFGADMSADWCMSAPEFHGDQLWVTCMDNGFMALQLTNGVGRR